MDVKYLSLLALLTLAGCDTPTAPAEYCTDPVVVEGTWTEAGYVITVQGCYRGPR